MLQYREVVLCKSRKAFKFMRESMNRIAREQEQSRIAIVEQYGHGGRGYMQNARILPMTSDNPLDFDFEELSDYINDLSDYEMVTLSDDEPAEEAKINRLETDGLVDELLAEYGHTRFHQLFTRRYIDSRYASLLTIACKANGEEVIVLLTPPSNVVEYKNYRDYANIRR